MGISGRLENGNRILKYFAGFSKGNRTFILSPEIQIFRFDFKIFGGTQYYNTISKNNIFCKTHFK